MRPRIDFLQGVDALAPGLSRAQGPLLSALQSRQDFDLRAVRFRIDHPPLLFPFIYGPLPVWLAARHAQLLHIANSWYAHLVPLMPMPAVVTCHDLIELEAIRRGETAVKVHRRFHARAAFAGMLSARRIVCDSRAIADRIIASAPHVRDCLRVVPLGISSSFSPGAVDHATLTALGIERPYVLFVGSEQGRKNLVRLVSALGQVRRSIPQLRFVKIGGHQTTGGREQLLDAIRREGMTEWTRIVDHVSDSQLVTLYRGAAVTVLPSLSEGFGFPPLEAMACGCPAIVSNRDSLPEIVGPDALVVDPLDIDALASAIQRVVSDVALSHALRAAGPSRASYFSWQRAADQYAQIYEEALQS